MKIKNKRTNNPRKKIRKKRSTKEGKDLNINNNIRIKRRRKEITSKKKEKKKEEKKL
jgi:hypothetical protein